MPWPLVRLVADEVGLTFKPRLGLGRWFGVHAIPRTEVLWAAEARHLPETGSLVIMLTNRNRWVFRTLVNVPGLLQELQALGYSVTREP
jgi:hypothetical protein